MSSSFSCTFCSLQFNTKEALAGHQNAHKNEHPSFTTTIPFACGPWEAASSMPLSSATPFPCEHCPQLFETLCDVCNHQEVHNQLIGASTSRSAASGTMEAIATVPHPSRIHFPCDYCAREFETSQALNSHIGKAHKEHIGSFACDYCPRKFKTFQDLYNHKVKEHTELMVTSSSTIAFFCEHCPKIFQTFQSLSNHKGKAHSDLIEASKQITPFSCNYCPKQFKTVEGLNSHKGQTHKELKINSSSTTTFSCDNCSRKFQTFRSLNSHKDKVHSELIATLPFSCDHCPKKFKTLHGLTIHNGKAHKENIATSKSTTTILRPTPTQEGSDNINSNYINPDYYLIDEEENSISLT